MGANIEYDKLSQKRNQIMDHILANMKNWQGDIESGAQLLKDNGTKIEKIKEINQEIDSINMGNYPDPIYRDKLNALYSEQQNLFTILEDKHRELMEEKQQLSKKDDVVKSYISKKRKPIFIDKDVE